MSQQQTGLTGAMKWLVLRYPEPKGTLIKLGSVLTDPHDPESSLTQHSNIVRVPETHIRDHSNAVRNAVHTSLSQNLGSSAKLAIPILSTVTGNLGLVGESTSTIKTDITAAEVTAKVFNPSKEYMKQVLELPGVIERLRATVFAQSLYIIIGVATAKELTVAEKRDENCKAEVVASVTVPSASSDNRAELHYDTNQVTSADLVTDGLVDFAYRVREFEYSRIPWSQLSAGKDVTEGALMGRDSEQESSDDDSYENDKAEFCYLEDEDCDWKG